MYVGSLTDVYEDGLTCIWQGQSHVLNLAEFSPIVLSGHIRNAVEVGQLAVVEREIPLCPLFAPVLDHERECRAVLESPVGIGLTLIPDHPCDAIRNEGVHHAVV